MFDINDADTKKALKEAVDAAVAEATTGLMEKNKELIAKLKKATKDAAIDPAEFQSLSEAKDAAEAKLAEALKTLKQATADADKAKKAYEAESNFTSKLLIDNGLTEAIIKAGVKPEMSKAVKALLAGQVTLKIDGENRVAVMGDKSLSDAVAEWSLSDEGKHFVTAPANNGGDAKGGGGKPAAKTLSRTAYEALAPSEKMEFTKSGGTLTN